jgi:hypothetical protein
VGPVTALAGQGDVVYWAEAHERDGATLSVLFRANVGEPPVRLGRARGGVAALLIGDDALYWASTDGIFRQARPAP